MKRTIAKVFQITDFIQWHSKEELRLSPKYQRNKVWNETAKSYLIDTILRGLPIPPIFIRQSLDINTKTTYKEVVDGQQRIRTIIEFIIDESFAVKKTHNTDYGGSTFNELDDDAKEAILNYDILVETIAEKEDSIIYDIFARLNSNNYILNKQEIRNAKFWGEFKVLAYELSSKYRDFFLRYKIISDKDCSRMKDTEFINSILILMIEGIVTENTTLIDNIYSKYDIMFNNSYEYKNTIDELMSIIEDIYKKFELNLGFLENKTYLFTLFAVLYHQKYGLKDYHEFRDESIKLRDNRIVNKKISELISLLANDKNEHLNMDKDFFDLELFTTLHSRRTTSKKERSERIKMLNNFMFGSKHNEN